MHSPSSLQPDDAKKIYGALAFGLWAYETPLNIHLTIRWEHANIAEAEASSVLGSYLNEARKWASRGKPIEERLRRRTDMRVGDELFWVYVHENSPKQGFCTHILLSLAGSPTQFEQWTTYCLTRLCRKHRLPPTFVRFRASFNPDIDKRIATAWRRFRLLMKQLDPGATLQRQESTQTLAMRDFLGRWHFRGSMPIHSSKRIGICRRLGTGEQTSKGFTSKLDRWHLDALFAVNERTTARKSEHSVAPQPASFDEPFFAQTSS